MKLKTPYLLLLLLVLAYFGVNNNIEILKPFYYGKDLIFSIVKADSSDITLSNDLEESIINSLKDDIHNLQKISNINLSISDYDMINATIISRNRDYWFNNLTINKGENDGITLDMAVIDSDGLIGRISMVTSKTAMVKLITTNDTKSKVSAVINNHDHKVYGIISGYDSMNNLLSLTITDNLEIEKDSKVETTGMGGVFPSGILIGKVYDVIKKSDGITNVVRVRPSSSIEGERYVSVLGRKKESNN